MRKTWVVLLLLLLLCLAATGAAAAELFIAPNGNDTTGDGSIGAPFATLGAAFYYNDGGVLTRRAQPGDTVYVRAGTYATTMNINGDGYCSVHFTDHSLVGGAPGSPITIRPYDGDFTALFTGSIRLVRCKYITLMGLDMSNTGGHPLSVTSGCDDFADVSKRSNNIIVTNCKIHDGGSSSGQCKIQQSDYITLQDCEFYNLGAGGATIDCVWVDHCVHRRNFLHNASCGGFVKGGSQYNVFESNVFVNSPGTYDWGFMPGAGTDVSVANPDIPYESMYTLIRNNIVHHAGRGALPSNESAYCYAYNNLWYDCGWSNSGFSYATQLSTGMSRFDNYTRHFYVFNNIFYDPQGDMRPYGWTEGGSGNCEDWQTGNNNYWNQGNALTLDSSGWVNPNTETGATYTNPDLTLTGSPTTWQGWINYFRPKWTSASNAALKDKGTSAAGGAPLPAVVRDIEGNPRPKDGGWDIGPYEYQGTTVAPVANFYANSRGVMGQQYWGTAPAIFDFADCSSGGPTSWSWNFGDSTTSTVQSPSHTYSSNGVYTVSLTATNSAGSDGETKTNYLTVKPLDANFTASPTWGAAPLAVTFTDKSSNSPTAWAWTFGDGSTSTAQNPSHTYNSVNYYTVALTATNANGNDTGTKNNYIVVCTEVAAYPDEYGTGTGVSLSSGSLSSLTGDDSNYMVFARASGGKDFHVWFRYDSSYTRTQVQGVKYDVKLKASAAGVVNVMPSPDDLAANEGGQWEWDNSDGATAIGTSDQWLYSTRTNMDRFMGSTGKVGIGLCGCRANGEAVNLSYNVVRFRIYVKPAGGSAPVANFSGNPTLGAAPLAVTFTDSSSNTPTAWSWTFGDSNTSTAQNPSHTYSSTGTYTVALTATNAYGNNTNTKNNYVTVGNKPVANFSGNPTIGAPTLAVTFTDSSTNTPTAWSWTFGDSSTSTVQNPSHSYTAVGSYTVALTATNAYGNNTNTKNNYITVGNKPVANFSGTPTLGAAPLAVTFTDSSTYSPTAWAWTFGDSNTSTVQNPSHTYSSAGTYTVALTATNAYGNNTNTKNNYITVGNKPVANFSGTPTTGNAPLAVTFTDSSTNSPTAWSWTFGDSNTSTAQSPSHTYSSTGNYTVALTATNAYGNNTNTKNNYISVTSGAPVANFSGTPTVGVPSLAVTFTDSSTGSPTAWSWNFGDSTTSTVQSPSHTYTSAGNYTVTLRATNAGGYDDEVKTNYIMACTEITLFPNSVTQFAWVGQGFTGSLADVRTDNQIYHITNSSTSTQQDGRRYYYYGSYAGTSVARMYVEYQYKGSRDDTPNYFLHCLKPGDVPETLVADHLHGMTEAWDTWYTDTPANYIRADNSLYIDSCGCPVSGNTNNFTTHIDVARIRMWIKPGTTISAPTASFTGTPTGGAAPLSVTFADSSTGTPTFWAWEFGDGTSSTVQSPSHSYAANGAYSVTLTVNNGYGSHALTRSNYINVGAPPVANFSGTPTIGAPTLAVSFTDSSTNTPTAWSWTFGDSSTSTAQNPSHSYTAVGNYTVALTATNAYGNNTNTKNNYITVGNKPVANFSGTPTIGAPALAVTFTDSSTYSPTAWAWTFGDSNTSTAQNPSHSYTSVGSYTVALTATNIYGNNTNTKNNYITVGNPPVANFSGTPTTGGAPLAVTFTDSSTNTPTAWAWTFGDTNTSTLQNPSHSYSSTGNYTVALTATNAYGNNTNTKSNYITVTGGTPPVANFSGTPTVGIFPLAVTFTDSSTNTPTAWSWDFGDSTTSTAQNPSHTYTSAGNYTVTLTATNAGGSDGETKTNYIMACTEITLFPNTVTQFAWVGQGFTGTLADVRTDNQIYHITNSSTSTQQDGRRYYYYGSYAGTSVARMYVEYQYKGSRDDTPNYFLHCLKPGDVPETLVADHLHGMTEAWDTWYTDTPANYIRADNSLYIDSCGCPVSGNTNAFTTYIDVARVRMWIKPGTTISAPTANFTGTPTTGGAPLAVTFTDSSTGSPTFWAWEFGDGTSSTVQSPSHSYSSNGTYSVTLMVNNGYGSNSLTRSNYITVSSASAPTFVAAGAVSSGTGAITPALPGSLQTNDILLLFLETANQAISIPTPNGGTWTEVTNSPQGYGTAAASNATRLTVFWSRYNGTQGAPTTSDSGNHQLGRMIAIRGATTSGDPCNITTGGTESTADTSGAIPGATTTVANALVVAAIATSLPDASGTANFSAWANTNLSSVAEQTDNTVTAGNGGGLGIATGVKATAGAYTTTSVTCGTATTKAMMSIAIKP